MSWIQCTCAFAWSLYVPPPSASSLPGTQVWAESIASPLWERWRSMILHKIHGIPTLGNVAFHDSHKIQWNLHFGKGAVRRCHSAAPPLRRPEAPAADSCELALRPLVSQVLVTHPLQHLVRTFCTIGHRIREAGIGPPHVRTREPEELRSQRQQQSSMSRRLPLSVLSLHDLAPLRFLS